MRVPPPHWDWMGVPPCLDWMEVPPPPVRRSGDRAAMQRAVGFLHSRRRAFLSRCVFTDRTDGVFTLSETETDIETDSVNVLHMLARCCICDVTK